MSQELIIKSEKEKSYKVQFEDHDFQNGILNDNPFEWDLEKINDRKFHIIKDHVSYRLEILSANHKDKSYFIKVNGKKFKMQLQDQFDALLKKLGMEDLNSAKVSELKAPMPGLVIDIKVEVGAAIKKGDTLMVLEAMKMENVLKSPSDAVIKSIEIEKGLAVEKNQILITFE